MTTSNSGIYTLSQFSFKKSEAALRAFHTMIAATDCRRKFRTFRNILLEGSIKSSITSLRIYFPLFSASI